jgi:phosphate-selective porin OprO/OprP
MSLDELARQMQQLRQEVQEARALKSEVVRLRGEVRTLRGSMPPNPNPSLPVSRSTRVQAEGAPPGTVAEGGPVPSGAGGAEGAMAPALPGGALPAAEEGGPPSGSAGAAGDVEGIGSGEGGLLTREGAPIPSGTPTTGAGILNLKASYRYSDDASGPIGGGGFTRLSDPNDEFTLNITSQLTADGTFFDRQNMPTIEQNFNIPFARTYLYGNVTKNWIYQVGTQGFLGTFNLLDAWIAFKAGKNLTIRAGKGLAPPLYEYYAFTPALEPVITNSPLFQMAAARPIGVMASGTLLDSHIQYFSGVNNTAKSTFFGLNRDVEYNGDVDFTPFKDGDTIFSSLGGGVGFSAGKQNYLLSQSGIGFTNNGEASTNSSWITSSGVPFAVYNPGVRADGLRTRWAPHIYWYGRFSVLAEYMNYSRELSDATTKGRSTQRGYYVNLSYFLTGERDFKGNGFQGYSTVTPLKPFLPAEGRYGPGAWQLAAQWSDLNIGRGDFNRGFINANRWTNDLQQMMVGLNWWPNKYTRLSFDYVWTGFNHPIPVNSPEPIKSFNTFWIRFAMFF